MERLKPSSVQLGRRSREEECVRQVEQRRKRAKSTPPSNVFIKKIRLRTQIKIRLATELPLLCSTRDKDCNFHPRKECENPAKANSGSSKSLLLVLPPSTLTLVAACTTASGRKLYLSFFPQRGRACRPLHRSI